MLGHVFAVTPAILGALLLVDCLALLLVDLVTHVLVLSDTFFFRDVEALVLVAHSDGCLAHVLGVIAAGDLGDGGAHLDRQTLALLNF